MKIAAMAALALAATAPAPEPKPPDEKAVRYMQADCGRVYCVTTRHELQGVQNAQEVLLEEIGKRDAEIEKLRSKQCRGRDS